MRGAMLCRVYTGASGLPKRGGFEPEPSAKALTKVVNPGAYFRVHVLAPHVVPALSMQGEAGEMSTKANLLHAFTSGLWHGGFGLSDASSAVQLLHKRSSGQIRMKI